MENAHSNSLNLVGDNERKKRQEAEKDFETHQHPPIHVFV